MITMLQPYWIPLLQASAHGVANGTTRTLTQSPQQQMMPMLTMRMTTLTMMMEMGRQRQGRAGGRGATCQ